MKTDHAPTGGGAPRFHSIAAVADICGVSTKTVYRWIKAGELVAHRLGRLFRISAPDLDAFLKTRREQ